MDLRYVIRNGEKVLQVGFRDVEYGYTDIPGHPEIQARVPIGSRQGWMDVPVCDEETGLPLTFMVKEE